MMVNNDGLINIWLMMVNDGKWNNGIYSQWLILMG